MILTRLNSIKSQLIKPTSLSFRSFRTMSAGPTLSTTGIDLLSVKTPNGVKVTILLEELIAAGSNITFKEHKIDLGKGEQKEPWFLAINPNGRIPAIIDQSRNGVKVWESASILLYLVKHYDTTFNFHFQNDDEETEMMNWIMFQMGSTGPMLGQAGWFLSASTQDVFAAKRYINESKRLFSVYETQLATKDYLCGPGLGKYSLADITTFPWIRAFPYSLGETSLKEMGFPKLEEWIERCSNRIPTKKALSDDMITSFLSKEDWKETARKRSEWVWKEEKL